MIPAGLPWRQIESIRTQVTPQHRAPTRVADGALCRSWLDYLSPRYVVNLQLSRDAGCKAHTSTCYVQVPKTGSASVKFALGIPLTFSAPRAIGYTAARCSLTLVTYREPLSRFISAISTVHVQAQPWCGRSSRFLQQRVLCHRLRDTTAFEQYANLVLDELNEQTRNCSDQLISKGPLSALINLLPQTVFHALLPPRSQVQYMTVSEFESTCRTTQPQLSELIASSKYRASSNRTDGSIPITNERKESERVARVQPSELSKALQSRLADTYARDVAMYSRLRALATV